MEDVVCRALKDHVYLKNFKFDFLSKEGDSLGLILIYSDKVDVTIFRPSNKKDYMGVVFNKIVKERRVVDHSYETMTGTLDEALDYLTIEFKKLDKGKTTISICDHETGEITESDLLSVIKSTYDEQFEFWVDDKFPKNEVDQMIIDAVTSGYKFLKIHVKEIMNGHKNAFVTSDKFLKYLQELYPELNVSRLRSNDPNTDIVIAWKDYVDN